MKGNNHNIVFDPEEAHQGITHADKLTAGDTTVKWPEKFKIYGLYIIGTAVIGAILGTAVGAMTGYSGEYLQAHPLYLWNHSLLDAFHPLMTMTMIGGAWTGLLLGLGMGLWLAYRQVDSQQKTGEDHKITSSQTFMATLIVGPLFTFILPFLTILTTPSLQNVLHWEDYLFANFHASLYLELLKVNAMGNAVLIGIVLLLSGINIIRDHYIHKNSSESDRPVSPIHDRHMFAPVPRSTLKEPPTPQGETSFLTKLFSSSR